MKIHNAVAVGIGAFIALGICFNELRDVVAFH